MRILFAEEPSSTSRDIIAALVAQGHKVTHVVNGCAAVETYRTSQPDLVLIDALLPELGGVEVTRQIKALEGKRWTPLLLMAGQPSTEELLAGLEAGADDYLVKPICIEVLEARIRAKQRIALIQDSLYGILDNVYEGIATIDENGRVVAFNKAAEQIFGYGAAEVMGANVNMLMPAPYRQEHDGYLQRYIAGGAPRVIGLGRKVSGRRKNGEIFPMHLAVTEIDGHQGRIFIGLIRDISEEEAARARIEYLANHDALTGLPNRLRLNEVLDGMLAAGAAGYLLFIDLDGFKSINDELGHEAGDQALVEVARRLRSDLGEEHFVGRLGGDEFVVILRDLACARAASDLAGLLIRAIAEPMALPAPVGLRRLGASIGISSIAAGSATRTEILTRADNAMYAAKQRGKNQAVLASQPSPAMTVFP